MYYLMLALFMGFGISLADDRVPDWKWDIDAPSHPDFEVQNLRPNGFNPRIGGVDFLSDGRMVITDWGADMQVTGKILILENTTSGNASQVTTKTVASNLKEPLGLKVVNDEIWFLTKDMLGKLTGYDSNNPTIENLVGGWDYILDSDRGACGCEPWHHFNFGLLHRVENGKDYFYGTLGGEYPPSNNQGGDRGSLIRMDPSNGSFEIIAGGLRTPNGVQFGPDGEIFQSENQGHWMPANRFNNLRQGGFYGMQNDPSNPFHRPASQQDPPSVWIPHSEVGLSPGEGLYLRDGTFKGQFLLTDVSYGGLQRIFLERINNEYQGAIMHFGNGFDAGTNRIAYGPDSAIYVGCIGDGGDNWGWRDQRYGLHRMSYKGTTTFEMLAIRSVAQNTFEIEFTGGTLGANAGDAGSYRVRQWYYIPEETYGAGQQPVRNLTVSSATVSEDRKKVTLALQGLTIEKLGTVVHFDVTAVRSEAGGRPLNDDAWYTLKAFGPAEVPGCTDPAYSEYNPNADYDDGVSCLMLSSPVQKELNQNQDLMKGVTWAVAGNGLAVAEIPLKGAYTLKITDIRGKTLSEAHFTGPGVQKVELSNLPKGIVNFRIQYVGGIAVQNILIR